MNAGEREAKYFYHTYKRLPLEIDRGEGVYLIARDGTRYLDMFAGLAVNALGYGHPKLLQAMTEQGRKYVHLSNYYLQGPQIELAELLVTHTGFRRVFFSNSGTEAIEGAIKIVRKWGSSRGKREIVSFTNSFHGRTMGSLSLMDRTKYKEGFGPFLPNFNIVEFNDPVALRGSITAQTAAVVLEFIQGEGGIRPVTQEVVTELGALRKQYGFLLVADEIQSGVGRTGKFFGYEHFKVQPDIVVLAKPIGGGLPLGAILGGASVADVLEPGMHGTTFGGNPVACAMGVALLREIMEHGVMSNAEAMGQRLRSGLLTLKSKFPSIVKEVRGVGLMQGMELTRECQPVVDAMREKKILINGTDQTVLRFLPPLIVEGGHIDTTMAALSEILAQLT